MMARTKPNGQWIPLSQSLKLFFTRKRLMGISLMLFAVTALMTFVMYEITTSFVDSLTGQYLVEGPATSSILGWFKLQALHVVKWLYIIFSRIVAFYLAFLFAYTLTSPVYVFLSTSVEKIRTSNAFEPDDSLSFTNVIRDFVEGIKIGIVGLIITPVILVVNFIPLIGQVVGFLLIIFYSALMFIDYPSSSRRWHLGQKLRWIANHPKVSFRLGLIPALISMIPLINIFFMALLFPIMTIHTTLNFVAIESAKPIDA